MNPPLRRPLATISPLRPALALVIALAAFALLLTACGGEEPDLPPSALRPPQVPPRLSPLPHPTQPPLRRLLPLRRPRRRPRLRQMTPRRPILLKW